MNDVAMKINEIDPVEALRQTAATQTEFLAEDNVAKRKAAREQLKKDLAAAASASTSASAVIRSSSDKPPSDPIIHHSRQILLKAFEDVGITVVSMGKEETDAETGAYRASGIKLRALVYITQVERNFKNKKVFIQSIPPGNATFSRAAFLTVAAEISPYSSNDGTLSIHVRDEGSGRRGAYADTREKNWPLALRDGLRFVTGEKASDPAPG